MCLHVNCSHCFRLFLLPSGNSLRCSGWGGAALAEVLVWGGVALAEVLVWGGAAGDWYDRLGWCEGGPRCSSGAVRRWHQVLVWGSAAVASGARLGRCGQQAVPTVSAVPILLSCNL